VNPVSLLPKSGSNFRLYYLVPISFIYLFSQIGGQIYLLLSLIALIGATSRQSQGEALYGPQGQEKPELDEKEKLRRIGTLIYRDKKPFQYSATSPGEVLKEGSFQSIIWAVVFVLLSLFQISLSFLYLFAVYELYSYRFELDFLGAVLLFGLVALVVNGVMRFLWPNVSRMDEEAPEIDPELDDIAERFIHMLYLEDVSISKANYEPSKGGLFEIDCRVNHLHNETVEEDVNQVAVLFCSLIDRSSYPVSRGEFCIETEDGGVITFRIDPSWCQQVLDGEISSEQYLRHVRQTVSEELPDTENAKPVF